jgi:hypothetical protein
VWIFGRVVAGIRQDGGVVKSYPKVSHNNIF